MPNKADPTMNSSPIERSVGSGKVVAAETLATDRHGDPASGLRHQ